ncbi:magnesium/cobalt transporter CorA [Rhodohalobacter barkolensis]|uniref:Magnesium transport protein CorA n=1 Tax=Rhodohalobacter barkolensis TaxID=2053187 RepID=A0A2N0VL07_9BACT|nr:magnesium/cobalt transporter CorA [Rhodohalobacter barkolensis]PKD44872.1 magnesium and cobalt transport protein CorA [Rhodohalobacter barkolensis]
MNKASKKAAHKFQSIFSSGHLRRHHRKPPGQVPGTAIHTGVQRLDEVLMTVHDFDESHYDIIPIQKIEKSEPFLQNKSKTWIQIRGLHDIEKLKTVWNYFELHPLVQEDIVSTSQRPKVEHYPNAVYIVLRMIKQHEGDNGNYNVQTEQISIVLGDNYVLSFQESDEPIFDPILKRLELTTTRLRKFGPDYLAYALADNIVDHYFYALDVINENIEKIEEEILDDPREEQLQKIHALRRDLIFFRKSVWSLRDGINSLIRDDLPLISTEVKVFLRDLYDHIVQVVDSMETNREMVFGLYDMYMSGLSNRMNEVMKVLTIIATIFIPLTFIAGIYGMNFNSEVSPYNLPELNWYFGYPFSLGLMVLLTGGMIYYFKRKSWF